ncbi:cupin domain-containing protein [Alphaproteobacteria bacterium]|nr:cupin domain-containing protein [Alphaproteobacteria bacterium]
MKQIDNNRVKVTKFFLKPNESTGFHVHTLDYVIVPITDGVLKLINKDNIQTSATLKAGEPYFREKGVEHNVINIGDKSISFIEIEIKNL